MTRNIVKEFKKDLTPKGESSIAKWASAIFKFIALGFVFAVPATYAIQLQLLGGVLILQLLPSLFLGLYTDWFRKEALIVGLLAGIGSGLFMAVIANTVNGAFAGFTTSLFNTGVFSSLYIAVIALAVNLVISIVGSAVIPRKARPLQQVAQTVKTAQA